MDKLTVKNNLSVLGFQVKTFPDGIGEAFDSLMNMVPDGLDRSYYGISYMKGDEVIYYAAVAENYPGEAEKYNCSRYVIEKGEYVTTTIKDWKKKTHTIKDVFGEMMKENCPDFDRPAIEWYINDSEMLCMIRIAQAEGVAAGK